MTITIDRLFDDPGLYFHGFDGDHAMYVEMDRDHFARSIFFDGRIARPNGNAYRIPVEVLLEALDDRGTPPPRLNMIHHVAHCGSTLLARALDRGSDSLVIREPFHLRQLAVLAASRDHSPSAIEPWRSKLRLSLTMLGKRFVAGTPVVVKGNVPISMIGDAIDAASPGQPGLLLHFPLEDYLAAVLRTPNHRRWIESVTGELRVGRDDAVGSLEALSIPQRAAALWLSLIGRYARLLQINPAIRSLDANQLFDQPAVTILASARLFEIPMADIEAREIASGPLFKSYAKNPQQEYDPVDRVRMRDDARRQLSTAFAEARQWLERRTVSGAVPTALDRPLIGKPVPLM